MSTSSASGLQHEWLTLQNQYDSYEKFSLLIKLLNITLASLLMFVFHIGSWTLVIIAIFWLQDGIWKTFQNRIATRLYVVEKAIVEGQNHQAMQFNSVWLEARQGIIALLQEYFRQSCKPTVAYPHVILMAMGLAFIYVV